MQVSLKRKQQGETGDPAAQEERYSPTSVLDPFPDELPTKRVAADPSMAKQKAALQEECRRVCI